MWKTINKKTLTLKDHIEVPKLAIGLKVPTKDIELEGLELDLYLNILTTIIFGASSEFRERVRNEKLLSGFSADWERIEDYDTNGVVKGAKTGFVNQSGNCAVSYLESNSGKHYICCTGKSFSAWRCVYDHISVYRSYTK